MSADNWGVCPRCLKKQIETQAKKVQEVNDSYGKVSQEVYMKNLEDLQRRKLIEEFTLREDYDIGVDGDGEFHIDYRASCENCGLEFGYKHAEVIP
jgi:hypothetical protein